MTGARADRLVARPGRRSVAVVYAAVVLVVMGSALPVPLLPLYAERLSLPPDRLALVFSSYLATMVIALAIGGFPAVQSRPRVNLALALCLALASDALFLFTNEPALIAGRVLSGLSVGFGLGAGAALAVLLRGDRGRSATATMSLVAGFAGMLCAALVADLTPWPTVAPFLVHLVPAGVVVVLLRRAAIPAMTEVLPLTDAGAGHGPCRPRLPPARTAAAAGAAVGVLAWSLGNVVIGLVPALVRGSHDKDSLLVASLVAILVAGFGIAGQYAAPTHRLSFSVAASASSLVMGAAVVGLGLMATNLPAVVAGGALIGVGQGAGYRTGLLAMTRGLSPQRHGSRASLYACAAYLVASTTVQVGGVLMAMSGSVAGLLFLLGGFVLALAPVLLVTYLGRRRSSMTPLV